MRRAIQTTLCSAVIIAGCGAGATEQRTANDAADRASATCAGSFRAAAEAGDEMGYTRCAGERLRALSPSIAARVVGPRTIRVDVNGDEAGELSLDRPYLACADDPSSCDEVTEHFLASIAQSILRPRAEAEPTPERLRCAIRPADAVRDYQTRTEDPLVTRPLVGDLHVLVMVDFPESARPLLSSELAALGLDAAAALERGRANVLDELGPIAVDPATIRPGSFASLAEGRYYESSRLLDLEGLSALERAAGTSLLIAVPTVDTVLIASGTDPFAPLALGGLSQDLASRGARPVGALLRFSNGQLEPMPR